MWLCLEGGGGAYPLICESSEVFQSDVLGGSLYFGECQPVKASLQKINGWKSPNVHHSYCLPYLCDYSISK